MDDNVRRVGNVSKSSQDIVVNTFNLIGNHESLGSANQRSVEIDTADLSAQVNTLLSHYKSYQFCFNFRCLVLSLPKRYNVHVHDGIINND